MGDDTARPDSIGANPGEPGVNPGSSVPNPTIPSNPNPVISDPSPIDLSASGGMVDQTVDPAMPNAMGVSMEVPPPVESNGFPTSIPDPNIAPNPFAANPNLENPMASAPVGTAAVMPDASTPPVNPTPKPEVVMGEGGRKNTPWVVLGVLALVVMLGVLGAFAYFSFVAVAPVEVATAIPSPVAEASPSATPIPREMTIEEKIAAEEAALTELQTSLLAADKSLSDKQGDLSE